MKSRHSKLQIKNLADSIRVYIKPLPRDGVTVNVMLLLGFVILMVGAITATFLHYSEVSDKRHFISGSSSITGIGSSTICITGCSQKHTSSSDTDSIVSPKESTIATSTVTSCTQYEALLSTAYNKNIALDASAWNGFTINPTAVDNYYYNQLAQQIYSDYVANMGSDGCKPVLPSPTLEEPSTAPPGPVSPNTTPVITCNTLEEAQYTDTYNSSYTEDQEQERSQISSADAQITDAGGGISSAILVANSAIESQWDNTFAQLKQTLNSDLTSINCPTT